MVLSCGRDRPVSLFFFLDRTSATTSSVCSLRVVMMAADRHTGALSLFIKMRARSLIHTHTHTHTHRDITKNVDIKYKKEKQNKKKKSPSKFHHHHHPGLLLLFPGCCCYITIDSTLRLLYDTWRPPSSFTYNDRVIRHRISFYMFFLAIVFYFFFHCRRFSCFLLMKKKIHPKDIIYWI
jgi:hypothetical protein